MRAVGSWQLAVGSWFGHLSCLLLCAFCLLACSVPNLEPPECDQARDVVREFYSFHFGNDMHFSSENLGKRRAYLTPALFERLNSTQGTSDPFTMTDDLPKAFRVSECKVLEPGQRVRFDVLLFWKTDTRSEQQAVAVESENSSGKWLVAQVSK